MPFKDFFPLISSGIVLLIFLYDRWLGSVIRRKELNRSWYFKVLLEPKLENIDTFFVEIEKQINISITELGSLDFDNDKSTYIKSQLKYIDKFKELKRKFELEVLKPILSRYTEINTELITVINEIENDFTFEIDNLLIKDFDLVDFTKTIFEHKATLLDVLYKPLNSK
ncbi:hypothetical protein [Flavobacterium sp. LB3R33]|uniref:hypothetical protein n=1 Tax=Flavobacterium sp. LB3R33 TaxID=3401721 RepID=UPI003AAD8174